jgi:hypothetical protein
MISSTEHPIASPSSPAPINKSVGSMEYCVSRNNFSQGFSISEGADASARTRGSAAANRFVYRTPDTSLEESVPILQNESSSWSLPTLPKYAVPQSRCTRGQIKGIEWMTMQGRRRFEAQQDVILSRWGVTAHHQSTCVMVPSLWSEIDPTSLLDFDYEAFKLLDGIRLVCYSAFNTSWKHFLTLKRPFQC